MMITRSIRFVLASAVVLCAAGAASAHHSAGAVDRTKTVTVTGVVKEFRWANPHSWIDLEVAGPTAPGLWSVEMNPPTYLVRSGWKSTTLKPGDKISVTVNPLRSGEPGGIFVSVTLPDGRTLGRGSASGPVGAAPAAATPATPR